MIRLVLALIVALGMTSTATVAFNSDQLSYEFDARWLTDAEKRFLQTGLALSGTYKGMIDGAWGGGSQRALELYAIDHGGTAHVTNGDVVFLAANTYSMLQKYGWERQYNSGLRMSYLVPTIGLVNGEPSDTFVNLELAGTSLGYSLTVAYAAETGAYHEYFLKNAVSEPYTVRKPTLWITSVRLNTGVSLYTRSDDRGGFWSTIMVSARDADAGLLAAVTGSIKPGYAPAIGVSPGVLAEGVMTMRDVIASQEEERGGASYASAGATQEAAASPPRSSSESEDAASSGTGFLVSKEGHYLTNNHVVEDCRSIAIDGVPATLVAQDSNFDLALLSVSPPPNAEPATFAEKPARLNSDVTVIGYPLAGFLGGVNVTRGAVTSLKGIAGDGVRMQISAPVQPGNSGGPVINASGNIVGIVVSKLDAQRVADAIGDIPQNVNFAVRAEIAKLFMYQSGIEPVEAADSAAVSPEDLAARAQAFTKLITCGQ